jgi:hypothetical protein
MNGGAHSCLRQKKGRLLEELEIKALEEHSMQDYTEIVGFRTTTTGKVTGTQN